MLIHNATGCDPIFEGVSKHLSFPLIINKDKRKILNIFHDHNLLARIEWPEYEMASAEFISDSIIILTLKLKSIIAPVTRKTTIAYHDNGVARFEEPKLGVTYHVEWVISRESTGKNKGLATRLQAKSLSWQQGTRVHFWWTFCREGDLVCKARYKDL